MDRPRAEGERACPPSSTPAAATNASSSPSTRYPARNGSETHPSTPSSADAATSPPAAPSSANATTMPSAAPSRPEPQGFMASLVLFADGEPMSHDVRAGQTLAHYLASGIDELHSGNCATNRRLADVEGRLANAPTLRTTLLSSLPGGWPSSSALRRRTTSGALVSPCTLDLRSRSAHDALCLLHSLALLTHQPTCFPPSFALLSTPTAESGQPFILAHDYLRSLHSSIPVKNDKHLVLPVDIDGHLGIHPHCVVCSRR